MSSRNGSSKHSHHDSKRSPGSPYSLASKQQEPSLSSRSFPSHKPRKQSSCSVQVTESATALSRVSPPSNLTPVPDSTSDIYQISNTATSDRLAYTQVDVLEVSAWTYPHQGPHHSQDLYQSYDSTQTSTCPYHVSVMDSDYNGTWPGYGLAPLERWLDEDVGDGGALALQLGHQLRANCTCIAMQGGVGMNRVNGTQHGISLEN